MEDAATTLEIRVRPALPQPRSRHWIRCPSTVVRSLLIAALLALFRLFVLFHCSAAAKPTILGSRFKAHGVKRRCLRAGSSTFAQSHLAKPTVRTMPRPGIVDSFTSSNMRLAPCSRARNQRLHQRSRDSLPLEPSADADRHDFASSPYTETTPAAHSECCLAESPATDPATGSSTTTQPAIPQSAVLPSSSISNRYVRAGANYGESTVRSTLPCEQVRASKAAHLRHCDLFIDAIDQRSCRIVTPCVPRRHG